MSVHRFALPGLLLLTPLAAAQQAPLYTVPSETGDVAFGTHVAAAGDVNGDGVPDLVVGAPNSLGQRGKARVVSGADGSVIFAYANTGPVGKAGDWFGSSVAGCGDLDGDGRAEFAIGQLNVISLDVGGRVRVYRGSDGSVLFELVATAQAQDLGLSVASAGDVDGDGVNDVLVGAPRSDEVLPDAGAAFLLSGATGLPLHTWGGTGVISPSQFGTAVAGTGDADLDGTPDVAVGAPQYLDNGEHGLVEIYAGATNAVLQHLSGEPSAFFGSALAGGLDVDGSGTPDLLVGSPATFGFFPQAPSEAELFDAGSGALLAAFPEQGDSATGTSVALGDVNGDGVADVLVGERLWTGPGFNEGRVRVFSGDGYGLIAEQHGTANAAHAGRSVAVLGDVDGDGLCDWAMGNPDLVGGGSVLVFDGRVSWSDVGHALAGAAGVPHVLGGGALVAGEPLVIAVADGPPLAAAMLVLGGSALLAPFKSGVLVPSLDALLPGLPLDGDGALVLNGTCPPGLPPGFALWLQLWMPDAGGPAGFSATNGLMATAP